MISMLKDFVERLPIILKKFYKELKRDMLPLEMSFLPIDTNKYLMIWHNPDLFKDFIIADYHILNVDFAKVTVTEDEFRLYRSYLKLFTRNSKKTRFCIFVYRKIRTLAAKNTLKE
jgi:deoxyadenosine/deoxycytidine kinase